MKLELITEGLKELLIKYHYHPQTISFYEREWAKLSNFLIEKNNDTEFTMEMGLLYLEKSYNFISKSRGNQLTQQHIQLLRVINMLEDYSIHQSITRRYYASNNQITLNFYYSKIHNQYLLYLTNTELSNNTIQHYIKISKYFLDYLSQINLVDISNLTLTNCYNYINSFVGYSYKTVEQRICGIRHFLRYLSIEGILNTDYSVKIHMPNISKTASLPSTWSSDELKALISAIDRNSPLGKRDYAMILVASILGLRSIDIKHLRFSNIDWENKKISIIQHKTNKPLTLPLPDVLGWAIIDYIKNARPKYYESDIIFIKHQAPFEPFSDSDHLYQIITKYMRKAGIDRRKRKHSGFHSLRHSTASMLLELNTPLPVITNILGHTDSDVTAVYLKTDLIKLKECVLSLEDIVYE